MRVYTVHADASVNDAEKISDEMTLVASGFNVAAFLFGPLWALYNRLWAVAASWFVAAALLLVATGAGLLPGAAAILAFLVLALFLGLEGNALREARLQRTGRIVVDIATGADMEEAERRFLDRIIAARAASRDAGVDPARSSRHSPERGDVAPIGTWS